MISRISRHFRKAFAQLPIQIQQQARQAYRLFLRNPQDASLRYRQIHPTLPFYSASVGIHYRAVGWRNGDEIIWVRIGPHEECD